MKRTYLPIFLLLSVTYASSMENVMSKLTKNECSELKSCIKQIEFARGQGQSYFTGSGIGTMKNFIDHQFSIMEQTQRSMFSQKDFHHQSPDVLTAYVCCHLLSI
jgi:hypothetical protein